MFVASLLHKSRPHLTRIKIIIENSVSVNAKLWPKIKENVLFFAGF